MGKIDPTAFIHPTAVVLGDVSLGRRVSVWPTAVLRGDSDVIVNELRTRTMASQRITGRRRSVS